MRLSAWECARQSLTPDRCLVLLLHPSEPAVPTILIHALAFPPAVKSAQRGLPSKLFRTNLQRRAGQPPPAVTSSPARQVHRAASGAVLDAVCPDAGCLQQGYARAGRGGREDARQAHNTGTPACPPLRSVPSTRGALASDRTEPEMETLQANIHCLRFAKGRRQHGRSPAPAQRRRMARGAVDGRIVVCPCVNRSCLPACVSRAGLAPTCVPSRAHTQE